VLGLVGRKCASPQREQLCLAEESTNSDGKSKGKGKDVHIMLQNDVLQLSPTNLFTVSFQSHKLPTCSSPQVKEHSPQCTGGMFQTRNKLTSWNMSVRRDNRSFSDHFPPEPQQLWTMTPSPSTSTEH